jgi:3-hydroxyacyl-[acyl-carrier-protein] dehydratase
MWIDNIIDYVDGQSMTAIKNVSLAEEYLHDHFPADGVLPATPVMPASLVIEGMAQTAGILVGAQSAFREKVVLAKVVKALLHEDVTHGETLRYTADIARLSPTGAATRGIVDRLAYAGPHAGKWMNIGHIDLMFSHIDNNMSGLRFPEENFVFSDNFRTLLEGAGLAALAPAAYS